VDRLVKKINSSDVTERPKGSGRPRSVCTSEFRLSENIERAEKFICSHESALHRSPYDIERMTGISRSSVRRIAKHDLRLKTCKRFSGAIR